MSINDIKREFLSFDDLCDEEIRDSLGDYFVAFDEIEIDKPTINYEEEYEDIKKDNPLITSEKELNELLEGIQEPDDDYIIDFKILDDTESQNVKKVVEEKGLNRITETEREKEPDDDLISFKVGGKELLNDEGEDDIYGYSRTYREMRERLGLGQESRVLKMAREMQKKEEIEKNIKNNKKRLYKSDKKCYNIYIDDKESQDDIKIEDLFKNDENKIHTLINIRKIRRLLKYNEITYEELAEYLKVSKRTIVRKLNLNTDLTANELVLIANILNIDVNELIYKNKH